MHRFRVWAPQAQQVVLEIGGQAWPMSGDPSGWWERVHAAEAGTQYRFRVDDHPPLADPRSAWQPEGVEGPSATVDHAAFAWTDQAWQPPPWPAAIVYELHVGTFTPEGTYRAAIERLEHLVDLGITHIELMPVNAYSGRHGWGYDGVYFYAPHHTYGSPDDLKQFVDVCHARGLAVLLDVVYNHLGPVGNHLPKFGPYLTDAYKTVWGASLNFDGPNSDEVRRFVVDNVLMWLRDYHFDGLRLDATHQLFDLRAVHILEQIGEEVRSLERELDRTFLLIAENDQNNGRLAWPAEQGGFGLDALWLDDFHHALHTVLTGEKNGYYADYAGLAAIAKSLEHGYINNGTYSPSRKRVHGRPADGLTGANFVACMQNHDQVGNRAVGDRISATLSLDRLKVGAALVMTAPFVPLIFQGEEWGASTPFLYFTDHADPALGEAVRKGRREEFAIFGWDPEEIPDPQSPETFARSKLRWDERSTLPHREILDWYHQLIGLRKQLPDLQAGPFMPGSVMFDEEQGWLTLRRGGVMIVANLSARVRAVPMSGRRAQCLLQSRPLCVQDRHVELPPESVAVFAHAIDR